MNSSKPKPSQPKNQIKEENSDLIGILHTPRGKSHNV